MNPNDTVLQLDHLTFRWDGHAALFNLNWQVPAGVALVQGGPASGKTTLLRVLAGDLASTQGAVRLRGAPIVPGDTFWPERESTECERMVVRDWWQSLQQRYPRWDAQALARHAEGFSLADHEAKGFFMLSTGSRRKAWLAAALASGASLVLIDEPFAGLDLASARYLVKALAQLAQLAVAAPTNLVVVAHYEPLPDVPWTTQLELPDAAG